MASRRARKDARKRERGLGRFEGLTRKLKEGPLAEADLVVNPAGAEKMSDVLERFVEPFRGPVESRDDFHKLLYLATAAWNVALLPAGQRAQALDDLIGRGFRGTPADVVAEIRTILGAMIAHKLAHFPANRRFIVAFDLQGTGEDYHLSVASSLPDSAGP